MLVITTGRCYKVGQINDFKGNKQLRFEMICKNQKKVNDKWEDIGSPLFVSVSLWNDKIEQFAGIIADKTNYIVAGELIMDDKNGKHWYNMNADLVLLANDFTIFKDLREVIKKYSPAINESVVVDDAGFDSEVPF